MSNERLTDVERMRTDALAGTLDRRQVLKRGMALGLSAPIIAGLLAACGDDDEDVVGDVEDVGTGADATTPAEADEETPEMEDAETPAGEETPEMDDAETPESEGASGSAGGGGLLRLLWWQAPTILNPHLAQGTKDFDASQVCLEPLANYNSSGELVPFLAAEIPSLENGDVAEDGLSVTWRLRENVKWHDGEDFTADDVAFTFDFVANEETTATTFAVYDPIESVDVVDDHTVTLNFKQPTPAWYDPYVGPNGMILPEHVFADHVGAEARSAPANLMPIGTGPFMVREFRPADVVLYDRFEDYWDDGKPYFDSVELKGGGDSDTVARSVIQTGEGDYAWNIQSQPEILAQMEEEGGLGEIVSTPGSSAERIMVNFANPNEEVDGAFSEPSTQHPIFQHKKARNAIALAIQRDLIAEQLYGDGGVATSNNLNVPPAFVSPNTSWEYDLEQAQALLDEAGVAGGNLVYQTSINAVRQRTQEIIKQSLEQLGFTVELKTVEASIFFSSDAGNPDTASHFYADLEMYTNGPSSPYPIAWAERYRTDSIAQKSNNWSENNITRYNNPEFDVLHDQAQTELDPEIQAELFIAMNDMSVMDFVEIPIIHRSSVAAVVNTLTGYNGATFMSDVWDIKDWRREE
ncbi:MAG: peptide ABC transporter substrate-binding protein [Chloroflexia bacterium]|nr:peptide ABC transporter substrate-binding protein [Chloroflexia bacterium]